MARGWFSTIQQKVNPELGFRFHKEYIFNTISYVELSKLYQNCIKPGFNGKANILNFVSVTMFPMSVLFRNLKDTCITNSSYFIIKLFSFFSM